MNHRVSLFLLFILLLFISCGEEDMQNDEFNYEITIMQPNEEDKHVGDSIHLHVNFDEKEGNTVHHINVLIKNASDGSVIYSKPDAAHVHEQSGHYEHHDDFVLNVIEHSDWILEAKVWGHEEGVSVIEKSIQFHVHP